MILISHEEFWVLDFEELHSFKDKGIACSKFLNEKCNIPMLLPFIGIYSYSFCSNALIVSIYLPIYIGVAEKFSCFHFQTVNTKIENFHNINNGPGMSMSIYPADHAD